MARKITMTDDQFVDLMLLSYRRGCEDAIIVTQLGIKALEEDLEEGGTLKTQFLETVHAIPTKEAF